MLPEHSTVNTKGSTMDVKTFSLEEKKRDLANLFISAVEHPEPIDALIKGSHYYYLLLLFISNGTHL